ncbi:MarR family winged helix-turn-helix transcriptional regulator [Bradyrhizobium sp. Ai1a-2]|uniref:MarR family winged helix-turn-helix transcriptional regulator n=1 Tax=Bradyrhizobium sp. Ai1a-2 TaxID=196490 RepID=UPI0003F7152B|nr:MarR family winged helix-turn-helix transcriptional regulator [Bradyrhizobium sp. Ai1a-2]
MRPQSASFDNCCNTAVRRAARQLGQLYDDVIESSGLRSTQGTLMAVVSNAGAATASELAEWLVMDLSALGHTLKPLIRDGFLRSTPDPRDRRARRITLTAKGTKKLEQIHADWLIAQRALLATFGEPEAFALVKALDRISDPAFADKFRSTVQKLREQPQRKSG